MRGNLAVQYAGTALAWGASFLFIKVGLEGLSFTQVVLWRLVFGAVTSVPSSDSPDAVAARSGDMGAPVGIGGRPVCGAVVAVQLGRAEHQFGPGQHLQRDHTAHDDVGGAGVPPGEKLTDAKLFGLLLGFTGVVVVLAPWQAGIVGSVPAQLACLGATASYGVALVYLRRFILPRGVGTPTIAFMQVSIAAAAMLLAAPWVASTPMHLTPAIVASMIGLGAFGTGLAFVWNTNVVRSWGPTAASTVTYLTPVVGVVLGAVALDEHISWNQPVGALAVIAGIVVTQRSSRKAAETVTAPP